MHEYSTLVDFVMEWLDEQRKAMEPLGTGLSVGPVPSQRRVLEIYAAEAPAVDGKMKDIGELWDRIKTADIALDPAIRQPQEVEKALKELQWMSSQRAARLDALEGWLSKLPLSPSVA